MKLYTVLGTYYGTQAEAHKAAREAGGTFLQVEVPTDKPGLIEYLNAKRTIYSTVDAGYLDVVKDVNEDLDPSLAPPKSVIDPKPSYTEQSVDLEERWSLLPLARKLHFAALAVEDARVLVPGVTVAEVVDTVNAMFEPDPRLDDLVWKPVEEVDPFA
jgi:hypothetical protein